MNTTRTLPASSLHPLLIMRVQRLLLSMTALPKTALLLALSATVLTSALPAMARAATPTLQSAAHQSTAPKSPTTKSTTPQSASAKNSAEKGPAEKSSGTKGTALKVAPPHTLMPQDAMHKSLGVVNCASSMCHGATAPWKGSRILQNEYSTWLRFDKHANAYNLLLNDESRRMAKKLGLAKPAHEEKICLDCHAHNPPEQNRGERFALSDGVSCEACHGPAEHWIKSHTDAATTHVQNIQNGLYPTSQPVPMAKLCLSCHFGNDKKLVTHRLMGAGHPRLMFDLDTFANFQPPHYAIDKDWQARKGEFDGVRLWAIGQAVAVQSLLTTLADPVQGRDGLFPELVVFDCHACHHPMSDKRWQPRQGIGPGRIRLNDANLLMLRTIVKIVSPADAPAFSAQILSLHKAIAGESPGADALAEAKKLSRLIDRQIPLFEARRFDTGDVTRILRQLIDEGMADGYTDYAGAEQAFMAISGVANHWQKSGALSPATARQFRHHLDTLRQTLANDEKYSPAAFKAELQKLRQLIGTPPPPATGRS
ncbi:MAG: multiheme c-type cytochrome [Moraxellaceae bacterium]|nr:multiheme c-type cytochrome [Moraxellaceae bacterium]